jgi:nitrite reductase (NO-forming)
MKRVAGGFAAVTLVTTMLAFGVFAASGVASSERAAANTKVTVAASEFKFVLSKRSAPAGTVTFVVTNKGKVTHDFKIAGKKTPLLKPGKSATLRVTLRKGRYPYLCTVPGHAPAGMKGAFTVTG